MAKMDKTRDVVFVESLSSAGTGSSSGVFDKRFDGRHAI